MRCCSLFMFLLFFADTVQLFAVVLSSDPCLNMCIFLLVYVGHQFLIRTSFFCTVIQALNNLRWTYLTKVKKSQRSLHVLGIKSRFPYQHLVLCQSLKGMKRWLSGKLFIYFEKFVTIKHGKAKRLY